MSTIQYAPHDVANVGLSQKSQRLLIEGHIEEVKTDGLRRWVVHTNPAWNTKRPIHINDTMNGLDRRCYCFQGKRYLRGDSDLMCSHLAAVNHHTKHARP